LSTQESRTHQFCPTTIVYARKLLLTSDYLEMCCRMPPKTLANLNWPFYFTRLVLQRYNFERLLALIVSRGTGKDGVIVPIKSTKIYKKNETGVFRLAEKIPAQRRLKIKLKYTGKIGNGMIGLYTMAYESYNGST
ncbi:hypothetical protein OSTOST_22666, partial [Ostertagia ostertagi]